MVIGDGLLLGLPHHRHHSSWKKRYGFGCPPDPSQLKVEPGHHSHPGFAEDDS